MGLTLFGISSFYCLFTWYRVPVHPWLAWNSTRLHTGLEFIEIHLPCLLMLGLKACTTPSRDVLYFHDIKSIYLSGSIYHISGSFIMLWVFSLVEHVYFWSDGSQFRPSLLSARLTHRSRQGRRCPCQSQHGLLLSCSHLKHFCSGACPRFATPLWACLWFCCHSFPWGVKMSAFIWYL